MKQRVWQNLSQNKNSTGGWVLFEVWEVDYQPDIYVKAFETTVDDNYIMVTCNHFWTKEQADKYLAETDTVFTMPILIGENNGSE